MTAQIDLEDYACTSNCMPTSCKRECNEQLKSNQTVKHLNFQPPQMPFKSEILSEARRCLYCGTPGCVVACPSSLNTKQMIHAASVEDYYFAAKIAFSANPLALSTSQLCECSEGLCQSGCVMSKLGKSIRTNDIQRFVCAEFTKYGIQQKVKSEKLGKSVAIIGSGPGGLSSATFLARLGFDVEIFEREQFAGGLLMTQISQHRLSKDDVEAEIKFVTDLGVKINLNREIKSLEELLKFDFVVSAVGKQVNIPLPFAQKESEIQFLSSAEFLRNVNFEKKLGISGSSYDFTGKRIIVLGGGNTAADCAEVALRLNSGSVTMCFRKEISDLRCSQENIKTLIQSGVNLQSLLEACDNTKNQLEFDRNEKFNGKYVATGEKTKIQADIVIVAYGTRKCDFAKLSGVYYVGDAADSNSVIEAVNDGKNVAKLLFEKVTGKLINTLPEFYSDVDEVSLQSQIGNIKWVNPFMTSSSPTTLTYEHCRRALQAGSGGVVTKTACLTKDVHIENSLRIFKITNINGDNTYGNNCMISDHPEEYWPLAIRKLKQEYPDRIVIASIMCSDVKEDWQKMAKLMEDAGADALELNFSCPNQCASEGDESAFADSSKLMAMAIGQIPQALERCTKYVLEVVKIPVFPKLTPNHINGDLDEYAEAARNAGSAGVSYSNTISSLARIFPNGRPYPQIGEQKLSLPSNGYSGSAIRPIVLAGIAKIRGRFTPNELGLLGIGGIESADTALQFILSGAQALQVCSSVQTWSYEIIEEMTAGMQFLMYCRTTPRLREYLEQYGQQSIMPGEKTEWWTLSSKQDKNVPSLTEICGEAQLYLKNRDKIQHVNVWQSKAVVDQDKCIRCGTCATSCRDNGAHAFITGPDRRVEVKEDWCIGCMLCSTVCPVEAIRMTVTKPDKQLVYHTDDVLHE